VRATPTVGLTRQQAEDVLYHEARLLDERRFEDWLELFTADGLYWLPMDDGVDPALEPSILFADANERALRVYQILHQPHYAQLPPSRTARVVANIEVAPAERDDEVVVYGTLVIHELRGGDHFQLGLGDQRALAGRCEYRLRHDEGIWRIALKKVMLVDRDLPFHNLSFLV
jgi:3-phenylpropionate/cinnamic acid dioxygenase small subunit